MMFQPTLCRAVFFAIFLAAVGLRGIQAEDSRTGGDEQAPWVMVGILARNAAHMLPNFLGYLENLDYPKHRMSIWIRTDHNEDDTLKMLREWTDKAQPLYSSVDLHHEEQWLYASKDPLLRNKERYIRISQLRQEGLEAARKSGAHYLLWLDCDAFLVNNQTLRLLVEQQKPVVSPMLESEKDTVYSNFWCGQDEMGYYRRTPEYLPIRKRHKIGCFKVAVVHGAVLIDVWNPRSRGLTYWPLTTGFKGPVDDMIHFAYSAKYEELDMYVLNTEPLFGFIMKPREYKGLGHVLREFEFFKLQNLVNHPPVPRSQYITTKTLKDKAGLDEIFVINLERQPERKNWMIACFEELHLNATWFKAIDGRQLNQTWLDKLGVTFMPGKKTLTYDEIGNFLSHYFIWKEMLKQDFQKVMVLEDDVNFFRPGFRENLQMVLDDAQKYTPSWDLIFLGRDSQQNEDTLELIPGTRKLLVPHYSHWTIGYLLSLRGARKLVEAKPLENLIPVDNYFHVLAKTHPEKDWAARFPIQKFEQYSAYPLLVSQKKEIGSHQGQLKGRVEL